jgi:hypothetical protein
MNTTIPAHLVSVLRSAVLTGLGDAASPIEEASLTYRKEEHPEYFSGPLEQFDAIRALLDRIGWSDAERVLDIVGYRHLLAKALTDRLEADRGFVTDKVIEPTEREATERAIASIEHFLTANGLSDGDA